MNDQSTYQTLANTVAQVYGIPQQLFSNLVGVESSWNPDATGSAGEIGLAQLTPAIVNEYGINPYDPYDNLSAGAAYLKSLYDQYGDWPSALSAYNSGSPDTSAGFAYAMNVLAGKNAGGEVVGAAVSPDTGLPLSDTANQVAGPVPTAGGLLGNFWTQLQTDLGLVGQDQIYPGGPTVNESIAAAGGAPSQLTTAGTAAGTTPAAGSSTAPALKALGLSSWGVLGQYGLAILVAGGAIVVGFLIVARSGMEKVKAL